MEHSLAGRTSHTSTDVWSLSSFEEKSSGNENTLEMKPSMSYEVVANFIGATLLPFAQLR